MLSLKQFFKKERKEPNLYIFTGSGLSEPSGIQTFRDNNGLWHDYDPMEVANMLTFKANKEKVFEFYNQRRAMLPHVKPTDGHYLIADLQNEFGLDRVKVVTQNVDDLLERAGCTEVIHVHGELTKMMCLAHRHIWDIGYSEFKLGDPCPVCGNTGTKPGVVFFHEYAPEYELMDRIFSDKKRHFNDVVLCIGTRFEVVKTERILGYKSSFNILVNKHDDYGIPYERFDEVIFGDIADNSEKVARLVREKMS